jgi:hypothetical protein
MSEQQFLPETYDLYVLGVLEGDELEAFRKHLSEAGAEAEKELSRAEMRVAQVGLLTPEIEPPAWVRRQLMETIAPEPAPRHSFPVFAWGLAAAMLLCAVLAGWRVLTLQNQFDSVQQRMAELEQQHEELRDETETYRQVLEIVSAPGTISVSLDAASSTELHAYWNEQQGLVLTGQNMPVLSSDRAYQLWVIPKDGSPVDAGVFTPRSNGRVLVIRPLGLAQADAAALAITDEPETGSPQPTTQPIWVGPLG